MKKMLPILLFVISALLSVGLVTPGFACEFEVFKFHDFDSDGERDLGEPAIEGWQIKLYRETWEGWVLHVEGVTNPDGVAFFENLWGGQTWRVWEEQVECWEPTTPVLGPWIDGYYEEFYAPSGTYRIIKFGNVYTCEGCTPGFWKNHPDAWPLAPETNFDTAYDYGFNLFEPDITLWEAVCLRGGGINVLGRHGAAALLNIAHPDVDYPYTKEEVKEYLEAGNIEPVVYANELGCLDDD